MGRVLLLTLFFSIVILSDQAKTDGADQSKQTYIVYMGAAPVDSSANSIRATHLELLGSVLRSGLRAQRTLVRSYQHGFSGFVAKLSTAEAAAIKNKSGVVSVFVDPVYHLHTTRSWDFLQVPEIMEKNWQPGPGQVFSDSGSSTQRADTIIGLLDTGIWPESKSFNDARIGPIRSSWKGMCVTRPGFNSSNCNRKLIGARSYMENDDSTSLDRPSTDSPRDDQGHGTHTASTAAGSTVLDSSFYGLAAGTAKGGSTSSRIAMYRVCGSFGCQGSAILAAFDDAVADGVDLLSVSLGGSYLRDFNVDPIAIGSFHAVANGITVVCSAGNDGPSSGSVSNAAPWMLSVAATTIDRYFESDVVLGGNYGAVKGTSINFSNLSKEAVYPMIDGKSAKSSPNDDDEAASHCEGDAIDAKKIKGKIVLCKHTVQTDTWKITKTRQLQNAGAIGAILINDLEKAVPAIYVNFPVTEVTSQAAEQIFSYISSTKNPVGTILPTITVTKYKPAPEVAYFSSRGPSYHASNIIKPDIAAPGVAILASWIPPADSDVPAGMNPSLFKMESGTSMACPHVAGVAASVRSWYPTWSPAAVRSAIMTTARQMNNEGSSITTDAGSVATPYDYGSGEISPPDVLQPGFVYDAGTDDYLQFLCNYGYNITNIKLIAGKISEGFECPKNSSKDLISQLNYPSIAVTKFAGPGTRSVSRTVTNVGADGVTVYEASIKSPDGLDVKVVPDKLQFRKSGEKLSYQVIFTASAAVKGDLFGWIGWSDGKHRVKSPFVISSS